MKDFSHLEEEIQKIANYLTKDTELRKDLCQEMRIFLWQVVEGHKKSYYLQGAKFKAMDYIKKHCHGREVCVGSPQDAEAILYGSHMHTNDFYDDWHEVDKDTEKFDNGKTL